MNFLPVNDTGNSFGWQFTLCWVMTLSLLMLFGIDRGYPYSPVPPAASEKACFDWLLRGKEEFERLNPGLIVEPDFHSCYGKPSAYDSKKASQYIRDYNFSSCELVIPFAPGSSNNARLLAFGSSLQEFISFDSAFKLANGFEAEIAVYVTNSAQCPAISFLRSLQRLKIFDYYLPIEIARSGTLAGRYNRSINEGTEITLLAVLNDGTVVNLSESVEKAGLYRAFKIESITDVTSAPQAGEHRTINLLIVFETARPLAALRNKGEFKASELFPLLLQELQQSEPSVRATMRPYWKSP